jgi:hypothetical protein
VDEVEVDAVDLGLELGQRVEFRLARAPVVLLCQWSARAFIVASWTPCDRSSTSSLVGQRVAAMR